jgi:hypothetical protein
MISPWKFDPKLQLIPRNWIKLSRPNTTFLWIRQVSYSHDMAAERDSIWVTRRHYSEHDGKSVFHSQRGIQKKVRKMAEPLEEVRSDTRRLLRKGLGLQTSRHGVRVFFLDPISDNFEHTTYFIFSSTHNRHFCMGAYRIKNDQTSVWRMSHF